MFLTKRPDSFHPVWSGSSNRDHEEMLVSLVWSRLYCGNCYPVKSLHVFVHLMRIFLFQGQFHDLFIFRQVFHLNLYVYMEKAHVSISVQIVNQKHMLARLNISGNVVVTVHSSGLSLSSHTLTLLRKPNYVLQLNHCTMLLQSNASFQSILLNNLSHYDSIDTGENGFISVSTFPYQTQ